MPVSCPASFLFSGEISDMDLLRGNLRSIYFKYLGAAFGSALISSIYTLVDMAMVGQYQGPSGTAALAVMAPIWNLIFSLGLLTGIGGSVLFSAARGAGEQERSNEFFSVALWSSVALSAAAWIVVLLWEVPMLRLFGGSEELLPLAQEYLVPIKFVIPLCPLNQMLAPAQCWPASFSTYSVTLSLSFPWTWVSSVRAWPLPSARPSPLWPCLPTFSPSGTPSGWFGPASLGPSCARCWSADFPLFCLTWPWGY